jgi:ATP-binding cassette subfamily D (ALD) long-chain fatty acid import protein
LQRPVFGVLDECTSAVSVDMEEALLKEASRCGITAITLSQRLALPELHIAELRLGAGPDGGWALERQGTGT